MRLAAVVFLLPLTCFSQQPHEQEVQRALIELDRRSAGFSALPPHVGQPLSPDPEVARQLRPYERMRMAEQEGGTFVLQLPPPTPPLPLPRREQSLVDPVDLPRARN